MLKKYWLSQNTTSMLQDCVGTMNTTAWHKTERVMSEGVSRSLGEFMTGKAQKQQEQKPEKLG